MPDTLDQTDERRMFSAIKRATDLTDAGDTPDAAIEKVARADSLQPGQIRLLGHAYNTGRQTRQWQDGGGILQKLAEFPLADPEAVIAKIYGSEKTAADGPVPGDAYAPPPTLRAVVVMSQAEFEKAAFDKAMALTPAGPGPARQLDLALGNVQRQKQAADELGRQASQAEDKVRTAVHDLAGYFRKSASQRMTFKEAEYLAREKYGSPGSGLMDLVYRAASLKEARAANTHFALQKVDPAFTTKLAACMVVATEAARLRDEYAAACNKVAAARLDSYRPFGKAPAPAEPARGESDLAEKAASLFGAPAFGTAVGTMLGRTLGTGPKTTGELVEDAWMDLESPEHANELRKIQANAMLTSMLTDPEDPISGHDPAEVMQAFNEISQTLPRTSVQPAVIRPLLRKRLEGHQEPFEAKEMLDIERGLTATRPATPNTQLLSDGPDKLLG